MKNRGWGCQLSLTENFREGPVLAAGGVEGLVEIDPENAGKKSYGGGERQDQDDRPDHGFADSPAGDLPEKNGDERDEGQRQSVADVHGAEKVAGFAVVAEMADGTTFVHFREAEKNGMIKDFSDAAAGTTMVKHVANRRNSSGLHWRE